MHPYVVVPNVIKPDDCEALLVEGMSLALALERAKTVGGVPGRSSQAAFFPEGHILQELLSYAAAAANSEYAFDVRAIESPQFTEYKKDQLYDWHTDFINVPRDTMIRKLTAVTTLKDCGKGGDFEIKDIFGQAHRIADMRTPGNVLVFPSFLYHRITRVKEGTRYSAVAWFLGPHFR